MTAGPDGKANYSSNTNGKMFLFFDTETNGLPANFKASYMSVADWPRLLQLSWLLVDQNMHIIKKECATIKPFEFSIDPAGTLIHEITSREANLVGEDLKAVLYRFIEDLKRTEAIVCHNYEFDANVVLAEFVRTGLNPDILTSRQHFCTMKSTVEYCALGSDSNKYPSPNELYFKLFSRPLDSFHNSFYDAVVTKICFVKLRGQHPF